MNRLGARILLGYRLAARWKSSPEHRDDAVRQVDARGPAGLLIQRRARGAKWETSAMCTPKRVASSVISARSRRRNRGHRPGRSSHPSRGSRHSVRRNGFFKPLALLPGNLQDFFGKMPGRLKSRMIDRVSTPGLPRVRISVITPSRRDSGWESGPFDHHLVARLHACSGIPRRSAEDGVSTSTNARRQLGRADKLWVAVDNLDDFAARPGKRPPGTIFDDRITGQASPAGGDVDVVGSSPGNPAGAQNRGPPRCGRRPTAGFPPRLKLVAVGLLPGWQPLALGRLDLLDGAIGMTRCRARDEIAAPASSPLGGPRAPGLGRGANAERSPEASPDGSPAG